jgi:hypothetical protein
MPWYDPRGERVFKLKNGLKMNSFSINEKEELWIFLLLWRYDHINKEKI